MAFFGLFVCGFANRIANRIANSIANRFCPVFIRLRAGSCLRDCLHKGASGVDETKSKVKGNSKGASLLPFPAQKPRAGRDPAATLF